jgi:hypothetical protein
MALTIPSPMALPSSPLPGDDVTSAQALATYGAIHSDYEHVIPPLVIDPTADEDAPWLAEADHRHYRLPAPRGEGGTADIIVMLYCLGWSVENTLIEANGTELEIYADGWNSVGIAVDDSGAYFDLDLEVTGIGLGSLRISSVYVVPARSRVTMPSGIQPNGARPVDLAVCADDYPLSVHRHRDAVATAETTYGQQFRAALAASNWTSAEAPICSGLTIIETKIEVPESASAASATLTVWVRSDAATGDVSVTVGGVEKTIGIVANATWYSETWSVPTAPEGTSRPRGVVVRVATLVDGALTSLCAYWSSVAP